ncbi:MAG: biopolymer transporter ExbD [Rhodocyclaceae bacterium]|nr:biopolymer transporter ExbD [Rhodocyclaceae bacterium]
MRFQSNRRQEEPEINLIPMIDILLVIIIFLMLTTTYSRVAGLEVNLPSSDASPTEAQVSEIDVAVTATGEVLVNKQVVTRQDVVGISSALAGAAAGNEKAIVVISADAKASHQSVVDVMQAAQQAGLSSISFATQTSKR